MSAVVHQMMTIW